MDVFSGGMFDFNGDGQTDWIEQAAGLAILDEMDREDEDRETALGEPVFCLRSPIEDDTEDW